MRDEQEAKALAIENRRRAAKGQAPLESLISADEETEDALTLSEGETGALSDDTDHSLENTGEDEPSDVLLLETGRILVDAIATRPDTSVAGRAQHSGNKAL
jgi:carboxyl-terminal processing protease